MWSASRICRMAALRARFSDAVKLTLDDKKQVEAFAEKPFQYEKQFEMASGNLRSEGGLQFQRG